MYCKQELLTAEGFYFNGKHTEEYEMILLNRQADPPNEKEIKENIPFMQGDLDFSAILGQRVYENRPLQYEFLIINYDYTRRKNIETGITNWLMQSSHAKIYDDFSQGYYYMAKCRNINYTDSYEGLTVVITFDAKPFKIGDLLEGNDIWDTFNFELDIAQITHFKINGTETITLYNGGGNFINPTIKASAPFEIVIGGKTYAIPSGASKSYAFTLPIGETTLKVTGQGTIDFEFRKELL